MGVNVNIHPNRERYLRNLHGMMQEAVKETQRLDALWNRLNDEINQKLTGEGITDIVQRTGIKSSSIPLQDAMAGGKWWREKAVYLATVLQAEIALAKEGI